MLNKYASSLFYKGRLNQVYYLHTNSVTEPPLGRPSGVVVCIACRNMGVESFSKISSSLLVPKLDCKEPQILIYKKEYYPLI